MDKKKCEYCGESIHINTRRCPFCGSIVSEVPKEVITGEENASVSEESVSGEKENQQSSMGNTGISSEVRNNPISQKPLSNAKKVFLTALSCTIPGFGQLIGIIIAIVFMSDETDSDRRSFGKALMVTSLIIFAVISICCILYGLVVYSVMMSNPDLRLK
ncbi:MAG: hypothetical protein ACM3UU_10795 [Ignavibacteriales bacterium]